MKRIFIVDRTGQYRSQRAVRETTKSVETKSDAGKDIWADHRHLFKDFQGEVNV